MSPTPRITLWGTVSGSGGQGRTREREGPRLLLRGLQPNGGDKGVTTKEAVTNCDKSSEGNKQDVEIKKRKQPLLTGRPHGGGDT